jgi:hypothetical protein
MRLIILAALLALLPVAHAQSGGADTTCVTATTNRAALGRVVFMFGDSISRGYGLGVFADNPALTSAHPLWVFRSIAATANAALAANSRNERFAYCGGLSATDIGDLITANVIKSTDLVIVEDAGDYAGTVNDYYSLMFGVRVATAGAGVPVAFITMFDYCESANMACSIDAEYDKIRTGGTWNDATRRAATITNNPVFGSAFAAPTSLIDMNWLMDVWRGAAIGTDGVDVMNTDGVHPNVWGQLKMTQHYLAVAGLLQHIADIDALQDVAEANYSSLAYGSLTFTSSRARDYVAALLN